MLSKQASTQFGDEGIPIVDPVDHGAFRGRSGQICKNKREEKSERRMGGCAE